MALIMLRFSSCDMTYGIDDSFRSVDMSQQCSLITSFSFIIDVAPKKPILAVIVAFVSLG